RSREDRPCAVCPCVRHFRSRRHRHRCGSAAAFRRGAGGRQCQHSCCGAGTSRPCRMIVGADIGTQSLKAAVLTPQLEVRGEHGVGYEPSFPHPGWAEEAPELWERALAPAIAGALCAAGIAAGDVTALGLTGQLDGAIAIGADGRPLHPCLIWMDRRADKETAGIDAGLVLDKAGVVLDATHLAAKIRWLKAHVPAVRRATKFHVPVSYMV